jgi:molecular chaperone GrpE
LNENIDNNQTPQEGPGQNSGPESEGSEKSNETVEALPEIDELKNELADIKSKYLRAAADLENIKRRHEKERQDLLKYGVESLLTDLLPVLDGFETANSQVFTEEVINENPQALKIKDGIDLIQKKLGDALEKHGLEVIAAANEPFDPNFHQAIQNIPSPDADQEVVGEVFANGYTLNGRVIRAAMVSVRIPE